MSVNYNNFDLKLTNNEKLFRVHIEENLRWNVHFQYISKKLSSNLWLLSQIRSFLSINDPFLFYNAYIRPHLDYCCVVWGNSTNYNTCIQKVTKLQRRTCKIIIGREYTHLEEAFDRLKILSFDVFLHKAKVMYKIANNVAPIYLTDLFHMRNINADNMISNLRSVSNRHFVIPKPNINLFKNSLAYSGAVIGNSIPLDIKNATIINEFINKCTAWIKNKCRIFSSKPSPSDVY